MEGDNTHRKVALLLGEKFLSFPLIACGKSVGVWRVGLFSRTNLQRFGLLVPGPLVATMLYNTAETLLFSVTTQIGL